MRDGGEWIKVIGVIGLAILLRGVWGVIMWRMAGRPTGEWLKAIVFAILFTGLLNFLGLVLVASNR